MLPVLGPRSRHLARGPESQPSPKSAFLSGVTGGTRVLLGAQQWDAGSRLGTEAQGAWSLRRLGWSPLEGWVWRWAEMLQVEI